MKKLLALSFLLLVQGHNAQASDTPPTGTVKKRKVINPKNQKQQLEQQVRLNATLSELKQKAAGSTPLLETLKPAPRNVKTIEQESSQKALDAACKEIKRVQEARDAALAKEKQEEERRLLHIRMQEEEAAVAARAAAAEAKCLEILAAQKQAQEEEKRKKEQDEKERKKAEQKARKEQKKKEEEQKNTPKTTGKSKLFVTEEKPGTEIPVAAAAQSAAPAKPRFLVSLAILEQKLQADSTTRRFSTNPDELAVDQIVILTQPRINLLEKIVESTASPEDVQTFMQAIQNRPLEQLVARLLAGFLQSNVVTTHKRSLWSAFTQKYNPTIDKAAENQQFEQDLANMRRVTQKTIERAEKELEKGITTDAVCNELINAAVQQTLAICGGNKTTALKILLNGPGDHFQKQRFRGHPLLKPDAPRSFNCTVSLPNAHDDAPEIAAAQIKRIGKQMLKISEQDPGTWNSETETALTTIIALHEKLEQDPTARRTLLLNNLKQAFSQDTRRDRIVAFVTSQLPAEGGNG